MRAVPGWMDAVDFDYELGEARGGNTVYASEENLRENCTCVDECGIQEVVVMSKEDFMELVEKSSIDPATIRTSNVGPAIWTKEEGFVK
jgi:hypothetical protein